MIARDLITKKFPPVESKFMSLERSTLQLNGWFDPKRAAELITRCMDRLGINHEDYDKYEWWFQGRGSTENPVQLDSVQTSVSLKEMDCTMVVKAIKEVIPAAALERLPSGDKLDKAIIILRDHRDRPITGITFKEDYDNERRVLSTNVTLTLQEYGGYPASVEYIAPREGKPTIKITKKVLAQEGARRFDTIDVEDTTTLELPILASFLQRLLDGDDPLLVIKGHMNRP